MQRAPVLLATHHVRDRDLILSALEAFGVGQEAVIAASSGEAIAFLQDRQQAAPALILLDEELPDAGGLEVLSVVRGDARFRRIPVVILWDSTGRHDTQRLYDAGANSCVRKPASQSQFQQTLSQVVRYWIFLNQSA